MGNVGNNCINLQTSNFSLQKDNQKELVNFRSDCGDRDGGPLLVNFASEFCAFECGVGNNLRKNGHTGPFLQEFTVKYVNDEETVDEYSSADIGENGDVGNKFVDNRSLD